jgi:hypothetical protein
VQSTFVGYAQSQSKNYSWLKAEQKCIKLGKNIVIMVEKHENEDEQEDGFYSFSPTIVGIGGVGVFSRMKKPLGSEVQRSNKERARL